jgi:RNA polymerase sigma factor (TIGR02999 family)
MAPTPTQLLVRVREGDDTALDGLFEQLYDALRQIAQQRLARYAPGVTLSTTALVHEAYIRLVDQTAVTAQDRLHFLRLASRAMRFVLVDHARARQTEKRGGGALTVSIDSVQIAADDRATDLLALDEALTQLSGYDERLSRLVEYRFFGGLTYEEIATTSGWSVPTVKRDWARARLWLQRTMEPEES